MIALRFDLSWFPVEGVFPNGIGAGSPGRARGKGDVLTPAQLEHRGNPFGVLALQPGYVTALVGLGVALAQVGRPEEAIAQYRLALELDPRNAEAHNNLGGTLANHGRVAEALPHFERAVALNPTDENARKNLEQARQILAGR